MPSIGTSSSRFGRVLLAAIAIFAACTPPAKADPPDSALRSAPRPCLREDDTLLFSGSSAVKGAYLDEPLMMLVGSTKYYYHANDLYSVAALTNSSGTVVERYRYDPYGKVTVLDASGTAKSDPNNSEYGNPFTYTGQRLDKETGLMYYKNRYYSTALGRFVSRDPIGYEGSKWNLYEYVNGRIGIATDESGLFGDCRVIDAGDMYLVTDGEMSGSCRNNKGDFLGTTCCYEFTPMWKYLKFKSAAKCAKALHNDGLGPFALRFGITTIVGSAWPPAKAAAVVGLGFNYAMAFDFCIGGVCTQEGTLATARCECHHVRVFDIVCKKYECCVCKKKPFATAHTGWDAKTYKPWVSSER